MTKSVKCIAIVVRCSKGEWYVICNGCFIFFGNGKYLKVL